MTRFLMAILIFTLLLPVLARAGTDAPSVLGIRVIAQGELVSIRIRTSARLRPLMSPSGRSGFDPGLVIDFPGARLSPLVSKAIQVPPGCVLGIEVGAHPDKVRVAVALDSEMNYEIHPFLFKDAFVVEISPSGPAQTGREPEPWEDPPIIR